MSFFRQHRCWPAWVIVLAMVLTIGGMPAYAAACGDSLSAPGTPVAVASARADGAASEFCRAMEKPGPCCCAPAGKTSQPGVATGNPANGRFSAPGCGCAVQAPTTPPPAELKATALWSSPEVALLPRATLSLQIPNQTLWIYAAPSTGPPAAPYLPAGPSRAPPAC